MRTSYKKDDVTMLLKDLTGSIEATPLEERENLIQGGAHYSEFLPVEKMPSERSLEVYNKMLERFAKSNATAIATLAEKIKKTTERPVLVSLARAGIPVGVMLKHYFRLKGEEVPHYAVSIVRDKGIDKVAMDYVREHHPDSQIVFVDGWTGKGAIKRQLEEALAPEKPKLAVVSDPAGTAELYGTRDDLYVINSCLNGIVSGLVSRTILRDDLIGEGDFHGAVYFSEFEDKDLTYDLIERVEKEWESKSLGDDSFNPSEPFNPSESFSSNESSEDESSFNAGYLECLALAKEYGVDDINLIKPGLGETSRVLLRRVPDLVLVSKSAKPEELEIILELAKERNVPVKEVDMKHYKACGIIKKLKDA